MPQYLIIKTKSHKDMHNYFQLMRTKKKVGKHTQDKSYSKSQKKRVKYETFISERQHSKVLNMKNATSNCDRAPCQNNFPIQNRPILLKKKKIR